MVLIVLLFISLTATVDCQCTQDLVNKINGLRTSWTAQLNFQGLPNNQIPIICDSMTMGDMPMKEVPIMSTIPKEFDASKKWSYCNDIGLISDQGMSCGGCWAFSSAATMSDRICISTSGNSSVRISPQNLITCCAPRHDHKNGCDGIDKLKIPFWCWKEDGIVTNQCQPYDLEGYEMARECSDTCVSGYPLSYSNDLHFGKEIYAIPNNVESIQSEIMMNGPITVGFTVYEDLLCYGSGVYRLVDGAERVGMHAVKMIGWGEENGIPYWLLANSWGSENWGALQGFFKVLRGENEVGIEDMAIAGTARISSGVTSLNKDSRMLIMLWVIMSSLAALL